MSAPIPLCGMQVFAAKDWATLMANSIVPKLAAGMQSELSVAPGATNLAPWHWAMGWAALLPPDQLVGALLLPHMIDCHAACAAHHGIQRGHGTYVVQSCCSSMEEGLSGSLRCSCVLAGVLTGSASAGGAAGERLLPPLARRVAPLAGAWPQLQ